MNISACLEHGVFMKNLVDEDREVRRTQIIKVFICFPKKYGFHSVSDREQIKALSKIIASF